MPGGPASKSKLLNEKDRIVAVAQGDKPPVDVVDMELEKVVQHIRGPKGTEVRLTISQAPDFTVRKVVTLVRDEIKLEDSEAKAKLIEMPDDHGGTNRIGIIDLPSFYAPVGDLTANNGRATPKYTSVDVAKLIKKLKQEHVAGIIIDLRYNPGGSLEEAIKFTGLFIKDGPVVLARNPDGEVTVDSDTDPEQLYAGPLRGDGQPLQRLGGGDCGGGVAGLRSRADCRRHVHARQRHGAKSESAQAVHD